MLALYSSVMFVSAFLLFALEPMVGKMLLPKCGGAPAVWNTCMVFFQTVLLLGYGYSYMLSRCFSVRRQAAIHIVVILLPLLALPVLFSAEANPPTDRDPSLWLFAQLTVVVGGPFFVLSTTAPLLQSWFAHSDATAARDPYFLYSTSNAGSLIALLSYPLLLEPAIGLVMQSSVWTAGYMVQIALVGYCAVTVWRGDASASPLREDSHCASPGTVRMGQRLGWVALALVPSSLMLGVTAHIATDIASAPLLWVVPLALYLLTFVFVFARKAVLPHGVMIKAMPYAVILMPLLILGSPLKAWMAIPAHLLTFFLVAMVCHGELARSRPETSHLTEFYLWMGLGGVLGGVFNTLVAPQLFTSVLEYPLMLVAACFLRPSDKAGIARWTFGLGDCVWLLAFVALAAGCGGLAHRFGSENVVVGNLIVFAAPAVLCFEFRHRPIRFALGTAALFLAVAHYADLQSGKTLLATRDFFGVKRVCLVMDGRFHALVHGDTTHGIQRVGPAADGEPLAYYSRQGPLGDIFTAFGAKLKRVAIIGLGAGSMAAYAHRGERFTFYEIDPAVSAIAADPQCFTFLKQCRGDWDVVLGDARLELAKAPDHVYDMIILDAFSSDSIPMHLVTREAMELYLRKLKEHGVLVLHISNRFLDLEPALARLAKAGDLVCLSRADLGVDPRQQREGKLPSHYLVMARSINDLRELAENPQWHEVRASGRGRVWTDDFSNIIESLRW